MKSHVRKNHWLVLLALVLLLTPLVAYAAPDTSFDATVGSVFKFFSVLLTALQAVLWPILLLLGGLLNNDLLFSGGMETMLLNIWSAIRDFVNILFVLGLLFIAIYNILGLAKDEYSIPKILPSIAIALIAVNFSFLMCKVVLDVVNVTTTAIFAVPLAQESLAKYKEDPSQLPILQQKICGDITQIQSLDAQNMKNPFCTTDPAQGGKPASGSTPATVVLSQYAKDFFSTFNSRNAALVMAIELMGITDMNKLPVDNVKNISNLTINIIFSLIFFVIYATAFVALFVAMLVRVVVLWISIALMPLSFLGIAFTKIKTELGEDDPLTMFTTHAIMPVKVSIVLTIGMILITQLKNIVPGVTFSTNPASLNAITSNMSTIQSIIAGIASAAFIWIAAFKAMKGTKAQPAIDFIKSKVQSFGVSVAKLPLYAPVLPTKGGAMGLAALGPAFGGGLEQWESKQQQDIQRRFGDKEGAFKESLSKANTKQEAQKIIAERIAEGRTFSKEEKAAIAEAIEKKGIEIKVFPQAYGINNRKDLLSKLKEGTITDQALTELQNKNPETFALPEANKGESKNLVDAARAENRKGGVPLKPLEDKVKEMDARYTDLNNEKDPVKIAQLKAQVDKLAAEVKELAAARNEFSGFEPSTFVKDGQVTNRTQADSFRGAYQKLSTAMGDEKAAKEVLITRLAQKLNMKPDDQRITDLANSIISGSYNSAPAAPAAGNPPANTPPGNPPPATNPPAPGSPPPARP